MTCPETAPALGAYVLGALDPQERQRFEEHLDRCPLCVAELAEFAALPGLLDTLDPEDLEPVAVTPSPELFDRVAAATRPRPAPTRRWLLVAAAVLAVLGVGAGVVVWATGGSSSETVTATAGPVRATVVATDAGEGSSLDVRIAGLHPGETCRIVAVDEDGGRHPAGQWPASPQGDGQWRGWTDVERGALQEVVLLGDGDRELVRVVF
jgi:hypothetical protein